MLLLLLLFVLFCPVSYQDTQAEEVEPLASTSSATIALAISEAPALNITPTASGRFDQTTAQVKVTTSSNNGYKLYLGTADATNAMYSTDNSKAAKINALTEPVATTDFLANTWGYALVSSSDNTNTLQYQAVPESATVVADSPQAAGEYELNFGVKLDTALPAGQYVNNVMVSAIANPTTVTGLMSLTYMQDMTSNICQDTKAANGANTVTPGNEVEKRLIDVRDGKEYWVAKLADGNCWMTQNLALDLNSSKALTSSDTDLNSKSSWTPTESTSSIIPAATSNPPQNSLESWNLGEYVMATPARMSSCNSAPTASSPSISGPNSVRAGQTISQNCSEAVDVSSAEWKPTFDSAQYGIGKTWTIHDCILNTTTKTCDYINDIYDTMAKDTNGQLITPGAVVTVDLNTKTYDAHYLIGNYYYWLTATANSGASLTSTGAEQDVNKLQDAPDSICPKGWRLPLAGNNTITNQIFDRPNSIYQLFKSYGYTDTNLETPLIIATPYHNPSLQPFYFTNHGRLSPWDGSLYGFGGNTSKWSATRFPSTNISAFTYGRNTNALLRSSSYPWGNAFPIRCLAR